MKPWSQTVSRCPMCCGTGAPMYAPAIAARGAPMVREGGPALLEPETTEVNAGWWCVTDCPPAEHLHWRCRECGYVWLSETNAQMGRR